MANTARFGAPYPLGTTATDVNGWMQQLAESVDINATMYTQGTFAARPVSTPGTPGKAGRLFYATDQAKIYYDFGTGWLDIAAFQPTTALLSGLLADRPVAAPANSGYRFFATDQVAEYYSTGSAWIRIGTPAGITDMWWLPNAPPGYWKLDGGNLPSTTGIYADLATAIGGITTPDTRGRVPVAQGTHADVDLIQENEGETVNNRRIRHRHTVTNPTVASHGHGVNFNSQGESVGHVHSMSHGHSFGRQVAAIVSGAQSASYSNYAIVGNQESHDVFVDNMNGNTADRNTGHVHQVLGTTDSQSPTTTGGAVGPASSPLDGPAYIVCVMIAKL